MAERWITQGSRRLRAWMKREGVSLAEFCRRTGMHERTVRRAVLGRTTVVSVDFAYAIERATGGAVPIASWRSETATELRAAS